jgi:hypothetical protein
LSTEDSGLFEVTCKDCNTTKSYFTAQGVSFFKLNHEGHRLAVKEPNSPQEDLGGKEEVVSVQEAEVKVPVYEQPEEVEEQVAKPVGSESVRLANLVVDVLDDVKGRVVKVYGIAGSVERFTKEFEMFKLAELNTFLESGLYFDDSSHTSYTWTPDRIDLSNDLARLLDEAPKEPEVAAEAPKVEKKVVAEKAAAPAMKGATKPVVVKQAPQGPTDEILLGKLSYIPEGEEYRLEGIRVSKALKKFRWNVEPPYVIGAMIDDLVSVQSLVGMVKSSLIKEIEKLGYTFVAVEAPAGSVTVWFRKNGDSPDVSSDDVALPQTPVA